MSPDALRPCQGKVGRHQDGGLLLLQRRPAASCSHNLRVQLGPRLHPVHKPCWDEILQGWRPQASRRPRASVVEKLRTAACAPAPPLQCTQLLLFFRTWLLLTGPTLEPHDPANPAAFSLFLLAVACLPLQTITSMTASHPQSS